MHRAPILAQREPWCLLPSVILGVSVEDQRRADERREDLRALAEAGWRTFVSYEPALGPIDWSGWEFVDWLISGGESGPKARGTSRSSYRVARDFCIEHGLSYLHKQNGEWIDADELATMQGWHMDQMPIDLCNYTESEKLANGRSYEHHADGTTLIRVGKKRAGRMLDGREWDEVPE